MGSCKIVAALVHWHPDASPILSVGHCKMRYSPGLVEVESSRLEDVLRRAEQSLDEQDSLLIRRVFESYAYVSDLVEDKNTSIRRLRELFFGARTEETDAVTGQKTRKPKADPPGETGADAGEEGTDESIGSEATSPPKGHGRNGSEAYRGATRIDVPHPSLTAGDACPACEEGTVYDKAPGVLVRITGQPPLAAKIDRRFPRPGK
jgi:transposase